MTALYGAVFLILNDIPFSVAYGRSRAVMLNLFQHLCVFMAEPSYEGDPETSSG